MNLGWGHGVSGSGVGRGAGGGGGCCHPGLNRARGGDLMREIRKKFFPHSG